MLSALLKRAADPPQYLLRQAAGLAAAADNEEANAAMAKLIDRTRGPYASWQVAAVAAWFDTRERIGKPSPAIRQRADGMFLAARDAANSGMSQLDAVQLLGRDKKHLEQDLTSLILLLDPKVSPETQTAALERLCRIDSDLVGEKLLKVWSNQSPTLRSRILDALLSRDRWANSLMTGLSSGAISVSEIDAPRRQRLREHKSPEVHGPARRLFVEATSAERKKLLDTYRMGLAAVGNPVLGKATFEKRCSVCHRIGDVGKLVGPDLTGYVNKPDDEWLIAILDPNRAVEPRYNSYSVITQRGQTVSGIISAETATSLTLLGADGRSQTVLRGDIDELRGTGKSLMPEGLERDLTTADMANLLSFVRSVSRRPR